jgi:2-polyprenyl-3-methyl-5-hydroxy-6-metoxy-1,4-benzoquinol methylase
MRKRDLHIMTNDVDTSGANRRTGDTIAIDGSYQYKALTAGNPVQRFWHLSKQLVIDRFLPPGPGDYVMDVGCGSGVISNHLAGRGASVLAVDGNASAIAFAGEQFPSENIRFVHGLVDESFDVERPVDSIYCLEVIEHIYHDQVLNMLGAFHGLLKPGGHALLTTPNYASLWPVIEFACDKLQKTATMRGDQHVCRFTPRRLRDTCAQAGFEIERLTSFCFLAPWIAPLSEGFARRVHELEASLPVRAGSILLVVLRKR